MVVFCTYKKMPSLGYRPVRRISWRNFTLYFVYVVQMIAIPISLGKDSLKHQLKPQILLRHVRDLVALSVVALIMLKVCSRQNQHLMETKGRPMTPTVKKDTRQAERQQDKQNKCDVRTCPIEQNQGSAVLFVLHGHHRVQYLLL